MEYPLKSRHSHEAEPIDMDGPADGEPTSTIQNDPGTSIPGAEPDARAALDASLTGQPGRLPETLCPVCKVIVVPEGKGKCGRCGVFLRLNFVARVHPINRLRRDQLTDIFVHDYAPDTQRLRSMCEQLAAVTERLESTKPGSPDYQRLTQVSAAIGDALEESRRSRVEKKPDPLSHLSTEAMIAHARAAVASLQRQLAAFDTSPVSEAARMVAESASEVPDDAPEETPPEPEVQKPREPEGFSGPTESEVPEACAYCHGSLTGCAAIREHPGWLAVHQTRPDVRQHLDAQAAHRRKLAWDESIVRDPFR